MRLFVVLAAGVAGCGLLTSLDDLGGGGDASVDVSVEPIPPPIVPCDANEQPAANALYVSLTGDDSLAGAQSSPMKTISAALKKASAVSDIYVDEGTYAEELAITSATTVHGGWKAEGANWTRDCTAGFVGRTIVRSPTARALTASGSSGTAGLQTMTIVTKAQADPGQSAIAIFVSGGITFRMSGVDVTAGAGGDGAPVAIPGAPGNAACNGVKDCSDGLAGATSTAIGSPAAAGTFDATGYVLAVGTSGGDGPLGHNGVAGAAGQTRNNCNTQCFQQTPSCPLPNSVTLTGGTGTCGCAGQGGKGGGPGQSGGASIGVYAVGATVLVDHSTVRSANGGAGGLGGTGGPGGAGAAGAKGSDLQNQCGAPSCAYYNGSCATTYYTLSGGAPGGNGGVGGMGALGGGGAGGPSYAIVTTQNGSASLDPSTALQCGAGGSGQGGAPKGANALRFP